jgi:hypothetical protein
LKPVSDTPVFQHTTYHKLALSLHLCVEYGIHSFKGLHETLGGGDETTGEMIGYSVIESLEKRTLEVFVGDTLLQ